jgi:integrase
MRNAALRRVLVPLLTLSQDAVELFKAPLNAAVDPDRILDDPRVRAGANWQENSLVFASNKGTPLDAQNIVNRYFKPLLRRAGLPNIRWHDLRHTCAILLLSRGVHPKLVQYLLGHASITMTLDCYLHWTPSMGRVTADGMDEALG